MLLPLSMSASTVTCTCALFHMQCPQADVKGALSGLLESHLRYMPKADLMRLSNACCEFLPQQATDFQQPLRLQAALLLGLIAWVQIDMLSDESSTKVTKALISVMGSPACGAQYKAAAADVLAKSYKHLQKHCHLKEIFLSMLSSCTSLRPTESQDTTAAVHVDACMEAHFWHVTI